MKRRKLVNQIYLNQISINSIETASGVFIGMNHANNWSSYRKNNYGFGSVINSSVSHNISYVIDNDTVDTPIYNCPTVITNRNPGRIENKIELGEININELDNNSAVVAGENDLNAWSSHGKQNGGQGRFNGSVQNDHNITQIIDNDVVDCQINDFL